MKLGQVRANVLKVKFNYDSGYCCGVSVHLSIRVFRKLQECDQRKPLQSNLHRQDREFLNARACMNKKVMRALI